MTTLNTIGRVQAGTVPARPKFSLDQLEPEVRAKLEKEYEGIQQNLAAVGHAHVSIGRHLWNIRNLLHGGSTWIDWLATTQLPPDQVANWLRIYEQARSLELPNKMIDAMARKCVDLVSASFVHPYGKYGKAVGACPFQARGLTEDSPFEEWCSWVDDVLSTHRQINRLEQQERERANGMRGFPPQLTADQLEMKIHEVAQNIDRYLSRALRALPPEGQRIAVERVFPRILRVVGIASLDAEPLRVAPTANASQSTNVQ